MAALAILALGASDFDAWAVEHAKHYSSPAVSAAARRTFAANEQVIAELNRLEMGSAVYGHTRFSDLSPAQFVTEYLARMPPDAPATTMPPRAVQELVDAPDNFDWRIQGAVTPVRDQGSCGSCWAFSAVQNVESISFLANRKEGTADGPTPLAVEQVLECDGTDEACYGGWMQSAFEYVVSAGGLAAEATYPYDNAGHTICLANQTFNATCGDGICDDPPLTNYCELRCHDKRIAKAATISSWHNLPMDEEQIKSFVATTGPVSVALDAGGPLGALLPWLQFYHHGVAHPRHCSTTNLDHGVLITGYGVDGSKPYWSVKNSWGAKWGESGYFRIARGSGVCGINTKACTSVV